MMSFSFCGRRGGLGALLVAFGLVGAACSGDESSGDDAGAAGAPGTPGTPGAGGGGAGNGPVGEGTCAVTVSGSDPGDITIDTVWKNTDAGCDYLVDGVLGIESGTLTIEPGVVVRFTQDSYLYVSTQGAIAAAGTAEAPIRFEGAAPVKGFARGIYFNDSAVASTFDHVDFRYLGKESATGNSTLGAIGGQYGAGLTITNSTFAGSKSHGLNVAGLTLLGFANNRFFDNDGFALSVSGGQVDLLDEASDYAGGDAPNGRPYVRVSAVGTSDAITADNTWRALNAPYYVAISVYMTAGTTTIAPGAEIVFEDGAALDVQDAAALVAVGTPERRIVFRGERDEPGFWSGLDFFEADGTLSYVDLINGGPAVSLVGAFEASYVTIDHATIRGSDTVGICTDSTSTLAVGDDVVVTDVAGGQVGLSDDDEC